MVEIYDLQTLREYSKELKFELEIEAIRIKSHARTTALQLKPENILQELHDKLAELSIEKKELLNSTLSIISGGFSKFIVSAGNSTLANRIGGKVLDLVVQQTVKRYPETTVKFYLKMIEFAIQLVKKNQQPKS